MVRFVVRRILGLIPVLLAVAAITFALMHRAPGGPWDKVKPVPAATRKTLNARFGLDKPMWVNASAAVTRWEDGERNPLTLADAFLDSQFCNYVANAARLDFGPSYQSRGAVSVQSIIGNKFPVSAKLGLVGLLFAVAVGIPLGVTGALRPHSWVDRLTLGLSTVGVAIPTFVIAVLLVVFLSRWFGISPIQRPEEWDRLGSAYLLPGLVLGLGVMAIVVRLTRASLLEVKREDFVRTARAKGVAEGHVVRRHMLRNALLPVVTVIGPAAAELIAGSIIIETIFNAPGLGREFVDAISARDYSMIMGTTIFYAVLVTSANLAVDVIYGILDPRVRV